MKSKIIQYPVTPWFEVRNQTADSADIYLYDVISPYLPDSNAKDVVGKLTAMATIPQLNVHINSPGGSVFDGVAIYQALKNHPGTVTTFIDGIAASIASLIAMAGDQVLIGKHAMIMIHNPSGEAYGEATEMRKVADILDQIKTSLVSAYTGKTGKKDQTISDMMDAETWFTAEEAMAAKLADGLIANPMKAVAQFDFKDFGYAHAPISEPPAKVEPIVSKAVPRSIRERMLALLEKQ